MEQYFRGIFAIACTPFHMDLSIDVGSLESCVEFIVASGAHGIVSTVNASEFYALSDAERMLIVETVAKRNKQRLPYVAGIAGIHKTIAVHFAKHAAACGADALIAMPPYLVHANEREIAEYYLAISDAVDIPIFIQNHEQPLGSPLNVDFMMRIISETERVNYIKEETVFSSQIITEIVNQASKMPVGRFRGVMGGKAGRYLIDEHKRGCCGNMPACEICDVQAKIWNALDEGRTEDGIALYNLASPLMNMEHVYGGIVYKEILAQRGIIKNVISRELNRPLLDYIDKQELERMLAPIRSYFAV